MKLIILYIITYFFILNDYVFNIDMLENVLIIINVTIYQETNQHTITNKPTNQQQPIL